MVVRFSQNISRLTGPVCAVCRKTFHKKTITVAVVLLLVGLTLSPRYLVYSDPVQKSDIIVQFVGSDQNARFKEARQLVLEGYADYLFIPTLFRLYRTNQHKTGLTAIRFTDIKTDIYLPQPRYENEMDIDYFKKIKSAYGFPRLYEDTHAEILLAKRAMDACGFRSAIFVSSPYHMKRIKIIIGRVFDSSYDIKLVPTRFEKRFEAPLPSQKDMLNVITEFPKMVWFLCYDIWDRWSGVNPV
jgi:uncharacterized SAM-binding protein YcdF (DUF218 family)